MSMSTSKQFEHELNECGKIPMFELECLNGEYLSFDIIINTQNGYICASGDKDFNIRVDKTFSLDEHLQSLNEQITNEYFNILKFN